MKHRPEWWRDAFRSAYLEVYRHRDDACAATEVAGLVPRLRAVPGPVIDAGCGAGRHLAALRQAGITAFGFDLSHELLGVAQQRRDGRGRIARGDLRSPPIAGGCGAVLCLFTAFGYFDDAGNAACLRALGGLLAAGGWLVVDLPDAATVRRTLCPDSERTTPGGWHVHERRQLVGDRVEKDVVAKPPGAAPVQWRESVRLYGSDELAALARSSGLRLVEIWPGLCGTESQEGRMVAWLTPEHPTNALS